MSIRHCGIDSTREQLRSSNTYATDQSGPLYCGLFEHEVLARYQKKWARMLKCDAVAEDFRSMWSTIVPRAPGDLLLGGP
jgi:hypothetical protein